MNKKWFLAAVSTLSAVVLGFSTEILGSDTQLQAWAQEHRAFVVVATVLALVISIAAAASGASDEAGAAGERLSEASVVGLILSSAVTWGVAGAALGWVIDVVLWPFILEAPRPTAVAFFTSVGPARLSCFLIGVMVGDRLRFMDPRNAGVMWLAGSVAGGAVGLLLPSYFSPSASVELLPHVVLGVPALAAAGFGASVAAATAVFKPRFDRQTRGSNGVDEAAAARRREQEEAETELFERAAARLRCRGYTIQCAEAKDWSHGRVALEYFIRFMVRDLDSDQRARLKKQVYDGTIEDVVELLGEFASEEVEDPDRRARRRQEYVDSIYSHPLYTPLKTFFESGGRDAAPRPPFVLLDADEREVGRFRSAKSLAFYADELLMVPAMATGLEKG